MAILNEAARSGSAVAGVQRKRSARRFGSKGRFDWYEALRDLARALATQLRDCNRSSPRIVIFREGEEAAYAGILVAVMVVPKDESGMVMDLMIFVNI
jgi:hypothetical protein